MTRYKLIGLEHPGWVDVYPHGRIALANISDDLADELFAQGIPYLQVVEQHLNDVYDKPITTEPIKKKRPRPDAAAPIS